MLYAIGIRECTYRVSRFLFVRLRSVREKGRIKFLMILDVEHAKKVGKFDFIMLPVKYLSHKPLLKHSIFQRLLFFKFQVSL